MCDIPERKRRDAPVTGQDSAMEADRPWIKVVAVCRKCKIVAFIEVTPIFSSHYLVKLSVLLNLYQARENPCHQSAIAFVQCSRNMQN